MSLTLHSKSNGVSAVEQYCSLGSGGLVKLLVSNSPYWLRKQQKEAANTEWLMIHPWAFPEFSHSDTLCIVWERRMLEGTHNHCSPIMTWYIQKKKTFANIHGGRKYTYTLGGKKHRCGTVSTTSAKTKQIIWVEVQRQVPKIVYYDREKRIWLWCAFCLAMAVGDDANTWNEPTCTTHTNTSNNLSCCPAFNRIIRCQEYQQQHQQQ